MLRARPAAILAAAGRSLQLSPAPTRAFVLVFHCAANALPHPTSPLLSPTADDAPNGAVGVSNGDPSRPMNRNHLFALVALLSLVAWLAPSAAFAGDVEAGKPKYEMFCVACHGATGIGDGPGAVGVQPAPRDFSKGDFKFDADGNGTPGEDADLKLVIAKGAAEFGGSSSMTPWAGALTDEDIDNVVAVIRSLEK